MWRLYVTRWNQAAPCVLMFKMLRGETEGDIFVYLLAYEN